MAKIIIIGPAHPLRGGLASYDERLAQEYLRLGHECSIYTFSLQYPSFLFPGKTQFSEDPAPAGIDIKVCINSVNPLNWKKVGREIGKLRPDLVIIRFWLPFMGPCLGTIAKTLKKNGHSRCVALIDNAIPHEKRPGDAAFTRYFMRQMDAFVAMSQSVMNDLSQFDKVKPRRLSPHPLFDNFGEKMSREEALATLGLDPAFRYVLFFGFIRAYKGLDLLLDAVADERVKKLPVKFIIAGEFYMDAAPVKAQIEKLGIEGQLVLRHDFIPNSEVAAYFSAADVVVQPYKTATQSGVTQIAYHFDVPMIVTNVSGLPENVPDGKVGYVVEVNASAVADGILKFFAEDPERFQQGLADEKKKYRWEVMATALLQAGQAEASR